MVRLAVLTLTACGGAIGPTKSPDPDLGIYASIDTGASWGTVTGALAGSAAPTEHISVTSVPIEAAANVMFGLGPIGLRPNLFAGFAIDSHTQRYIGLGLDLEVAIDPHLAVMLSAGTVSDTISGTPVQLDSMNGHRLGGGVMYRFGRYGASLRYFHASVATSSDAVNVASATTNAILVGFTASFFH
jgi:hypothetical protein